MGPASDRVAVSDVTGTAPFHDCPGSLVAVAGQASGRLRVASVRLMSPRRPPKRLVEASERLAELDPVMRTMLERIGPCDLRRGRPRREHFAELARAICYQQLAGAAARTIHGRFEASVRRRRRRPRRCSRCRSIACAAQGCRRARRRRSATSPRRSSTARSSSTASRRLPDDEIMRELDARARDRPRGPRRCSSSSSSDGSTCGRSTTSASATATAALRAAGDADGEGARAARRAFPSLPVGRGVVLLARRAAHRARSRSRRRARRAGDAARHLRAPARRTAAARRVRGGRRRARGPRWAMATSSPSSPRTNCEP